MSEWKGRNGSETILGARGEWGGGVKTYVTNWMWEFTILLGRKILHTETLPASYRIKSKLLKAANTGLYFIGPYLSSSLPPLWTLHNNSIERLEIPPNISSCFSLCTFCSLGLEGLLSSPFPPSFSELLIIINPSVLRRLCWHCNKFFPLTDSLSTVLFLYLIKMPIFYIRLLVFLCSQLIRRSLWAKIMALLIPSVYKTTLHKYEKRY